MAVRAGGAWTVGVYRFPPVGLMLFSVGVGGGTDGVEGGVIVVVVIVVVVEGSFDPVPPQPAIVAASPASTAPPATARTRRTESRFSCMTSPIDSVCSPLDGIGAVQDRDGPFCLKDSQTDIICVRMPVFAQYSLDIGNGQPATAQIASVHLTISDQDDQRWIDHPAQGGNQAQPRDNRMRGQEAHQCGGRL